MAKVLRKRASIEKVAGYWGSDPDDGDQPFENAAVLWDKAGKLSGVSKKDLQLESIYPPRGPMNQSEKRWKALEKLFIKEFKNPDYATPNDWWELIGAMIVIYRDGRMDKRVEARPAPRSVYKAALRAAQKFDQAELNDWFDSWSTNSKQIQLSYDKVIKKLKTGRL